MRTAAKWIFGTLAALALLVGVAGAVIYTFDWNRVKPRINDMVANATGRQFEIRGDLEVNWQRDLLATGGWRRYIPLPVIHANDLVLGNPEWAEHDMMATADDIRFGVELLPLFERTVTLRSLSVGGANVALERDKDRNNWTFAKPGPQEENPGKPWKLAVSEVLVREGKLAYRDTPLELALDANIKSIADKAGATPSADPAYGMAFDVTGKYRAARIEGSGKVGEVLSLRDPEVRFPVLLNIRAGKVEAQAQGRIGNLYEHPELDLQVRLAAPSMAMLYPLTGIVLPNTPPFATSGHLTGKLDPHSRLWRYDNFKGTVGKSDLQGSLQYEGSGERPKLTGEMTSRLLQLADLGPLIGVGGERADPAAKEAAARKGQATSSKRPGRVLPDNAFMTDRWQAMDLDLRFSGDRIVHDAELPLENVHTHAVLTNSVLKLTPLEFGVAQGKLSADITLDGSSNPMQARLVASVRAVQLPKLFPTVQAMQQSAGRIDGAVALVSRGNSIASLLGASGGEIKVYLQSGRISKFLLEAASLNIASAVVAKLFGDSEVRIRCAGVSMALKDGLATMRDFRISTEDALIDVTGAIDFADERLALHIKPESNKLKILSLRTPLYVNGTFGQPDIGLEKGPLLLRAGAAIALIAAAPAAAALLPLTVPGTDKQANCDELLTEARAKPTTRPDTSAPIEDKAAPSTAGGNAAQAGKQKPETRQPGTRQPSGKPSQGARQEQTFGNRQNGPASTLRAH